MAIQSKYTNAQVETLITEMLTVLEKHKAPTDLSLMVLGNCVSHLLESKVPASQRQAVAEQFAKVLTQSTKAD
ncbi:YejL family protein [Shewanella gelidii]|nr:YejL family protein [Shewanella gelidii]MCL1098674.1 YejL family protein [Shewanella gelidii]